MKQKATQLIRDNAPDGTAKLYGGKYIVCKDGKVFSQKNQKELSGFTNKYGYKEVDLYCENHKKHRWLVHRLVATCFIPNQENKPIINHKNGVRNDNRIENIEWSTHSENQLHGWSLGKRRNHKSSSGERYIYLCLGKFKVRVHVGEETIYVGLYKKLQDAIEARDRFLLDLNK